jgi:hypothetical protein
MAKLKDLAGLAALGAIGYKLSQQGKDDAGKSADSSSYAPSSNMTPMQGVGDATNEEATNGSSYTGRSNMTPMEGVGNATNNPIAKPKASASSKPRGMTGAQNDALARANKSIGMTGAQNDALAKANRGMSKTTTPATTSSVETKSTAPAAATSSPSTMPNTYRDLSGKVKTIGPSSPSASQMASDAVVSGAKKIGSGVADYVRNFETPAEARSRRAKEASGMKRGGTVKMASGGMASSASRRADGIATKGKTRGKIC